MSNGSFNYGHNRQDAGRSLGVDDFLKNRTRGGFDDAVITEKHLREAGRDGLTLWLHTKVGINVRWCHQWFKRVKIRAKEGGREEWRVFFTRLNSHEVGAEGDLVMVNQYKRKRGVRVHPPTCPFGKFAEEVYQAVRDGELSWLEPIVRFESDKRDETRLLRAGDFYGGFNERRLEPGAVEEAREAGVFVKDAWKQSLTAGARYAFFVACEGEAKVFDANDTIGQKWQKAIEGAIADYGPEKGNPKKNPYPFRVVHDDDAKGSDRYVVRALYGRAPTSEELDLIREEEPADASDLLALYDPDELRAQIEEYAVSRKLVLPLLDRSFPTRDPSRSRAPAREPEGGGRPAADDAAPADERYDCLHCGAVEVKSAEEYVCPKCGAEEDEEGRLVTRPCTKCGAQVRLAGAYGEEAVCPKCGAVHAENEVVAEGGTEVRWTFVRAPEPEAAAEQPAEAAKPRRRRKADGPQAG